MPETTKPTPEAARPFHPSTTWTVRFDFGYCIVPIAEELGPISSKTDADAECDALNARERVRDAAEELLAALLVAIELPKLHMAMNHCERNGMEWESYLDQIMEGEEIVDAAITKAKGK